MRSCKVNGRGYEKLAFFNKYLALLQKRCMQDIRPWLQWKTNKNSYAIYRMVLFPMTSSNTLHRLQVQGHDNIQRQITRKWYKIELYLQRQTN